MGIVRVKIPLIPHRLKMKNSSVYFLTSNVSEAEIET
jgi:hypothetical protein